MLAVEISMLTWQCASLFLVHPFTKTLSGKRGAPSPLVANFYHLSEARPGVGCWADRAPCWREWAEKEFPHSLGCSQPSSCKKGLLTGFSFCHFASTVHGGVTPKPLCSSPLTPTAWVWCEQASSSCQVRLKASGYHAAALLCGLDLFAWHCTRGMMQGTGPTALQPLPMKAEIQTTQQLQHEDSR